MSDVKQMFLQTTLPTHLQSGASPVTPVRSLLGIRIRLAQVDDELGGGCKGRWLWLLCRSSTAHSCGALQWDPDGSALRAFSRACASRS